MKKRSGKIKVIFVLYLAMLVILMLVFLSYARKTLILYEASQPQYVMEQVITIPDISLSMNTAGLVFNEFETEADYRSQIQQLLATQELQYHFLKESYLDGSMTYGIYAGDTPIGTVVLMPESTVTRMIAIPITDWKITALNAYEACGDYNITITVPDNYTVMINHILLDEDNITAYADYDELRYCREYVTVPRQITYQVEHLKHPADIVIMDAAMTQLSTDDICMDEPSDDAMPPSASGDVVLEFFPSEKILDEELKELVLNDVETYSNFFSRDLPGCRESIEPIEHLFPEDSVYLTLADQYRREDMIIFSAHSNTQFFNEKITEYIPYNEYCFSCRVSFDKSMTLSNGREMIDTTDNTYYFILLDDRWVIADIQ